MAGAVRQPARTTSLGLMPDVVLALLKRLRSDLGLVSTVVAVVFVTSFVFSAFPRLFLTMSDDGLRYAIQDEPSYQRNLQMSRVKVVPPADGPNPLAPIDAEGAEFQQTLAPSIQQVIDHQTYLFDTARYHAVSYPGMTPFFYERYVTLRYHSSVEDHIRLVAGRLPEPGGQTFPPPEGINQEQIPVVQMALTQETANQLGLEIGDRLLLTPDPDVTLVRFAGGQRLSYVALELSGIFEIPEPEDEFWLDDRRLERASTFDDGNVTHLYATGLVSTAVYGELLQAIQPLMLQYYWRYYVDPARFDAGKLEDLTSDLRRLNAQYGSPTLIRPRETGVYTGLTGIFNRFTAQRELTQATLSLAAIGLLAVAFAVIGLVAALVAERRRAMFSGVRSRGASTAQLVGAQIAEGLLLTAPAALLGLLLATLVVEARATPLSLYAALAIVAVSTGLMAWAALPFYRQTLLTLQRVDLPADRVSARRLVAEGLVVALAAVGVYLLRRRGLAADSAAGETGGFDIYLAAVPILIGLATGVAALRLYPLPIRLLAWLAALRNDLVPVLGLRRVARQPRVAAVPLLVLLLSVAVSVFSSIMLHTINTGQVRTSWLRVGADFRVDALPGTTLSPALGLDEIDGVESVAAALRQEQTDLVGQRTLLAQLSFLAVDTPGYQSVVAGTPVDSVLPPSLLDPMTGPAIGEPTNPIPAIVSRYWITGQPLSLNDSFALKIDFREMNFVVAEIRDEFAGLPADRPFVVTSLEHVDATNPDFSIRPTAYYLRGADDARERIDAALDQTSLNARLLSRSYEYQRVHDSPLIAGTANGFRIMVVAGAVYCVLAVVSALALTARGRDRDLGFLRTIGLSSRQAIGLTAAEQVPSVGLALIVGTVMAILSLRLIEPGLDLTAFTGPGVPVQLEINWWTVSLLSIGLIVILAAAVATVSLFNRRISVGDVLRVGER